MSLTDALFDQFLPRVIRTSTRNYDAPFDVQVTAYGIGFGWRDDVGGPIRRTFLPWHRIDGITLDAEPADTSEPF